MGAAMYKHVWRACLLLPIFVLLAGCIGGPESVDKSFTATRVVSESAKVKTILNALAVDANYSGRSYTMYDVTQAGFNFVDTQCMAYLQGLADLDSNRRALKQTLGGFGQTTGAILGVTGAGALSMAVVAQAFGLAQGLTDVYADRFLHSMPPGSTEQFVRKLMDAYRNGTADRRSLIDSGPAAYHEIQSYLRLCMPVEIEARIVDHISDSSAIPVPGNGATQVVVGSPVTTEQKAVRDAVRPIEKATDKLPSVRPVQAGLPGAIGTVEKGIDRYQLNEIQATFCVSEKGTGVWDGATRKAIFDILGADGLSPTKDAPVTKAQFAALQKTLLLKLRCTFDKDHPPQNPGGVNYATVAQLIKHLH
ncbi:hypothetical protein LGH82_30985 [Mesorhizobium sp. PAMC28654]|uniref:hypothetical protein n=1 Tax=Mesorhizobium sp. PAMC28654 TaxID=2880934 RepID=UPI001D0BC418|nr:hypothetical protein [Mesorhizobium sp. PAMC28654]UDL89434.1 hypothetical protein LGH82_30985 [Mesorhizobium sp. PAMC28654]